jgi:hypothetical protein
MLGATPMNLGAERFAGRPGQSAHAPLDRVWPMRPDFEVVRILSAPLLPNSVALGCDSAADTRVSVCAIASPRQRLKPRCHHRFATTES